MRQVSQRPPGRNPTRVYSCSCGAVFVETAAMCPFERQLPSTNHRVSVAR